MNNVLAVQILNGADDFLHDRGSVVLGKPALLANPIEQLSACSPGKAKK